MSLLLAGFVLAPLLQGDPTQELAAQCAKVEQVKSYTFQLEALDGGSFGGGEPTPQMVTGKFVKGQPLRLEQGELIAYRKGENLVYREGAEGEWQRYERRGFGGRGARGGEGRGGDARGGRGGEGRGGEGRGGEARPERPERTERPADAEMNNRRALGSFLTAGQPHELLADIGSKVTDVTKEEKDGRIIFSGKLTPEAAQAVSGMRMRGRGGPGADGGPQIDNSGTFRIEVAKGGGIDVIVFDTKMSGSFGERTFERTRHAEMKVSNVNATTYEAPAEATKAFTAEVEEATEIF